MWLRFSLSHSQDESECYYKHVHFYVSWWRAAYNTTSLDIIDNIFADMRQYISPIAPNATRSSVSKQLSRTLSDVGFPLCGRDRADKNAPRFGKRSVVSVISPLPTTQQPQMAMRSHSAISSTGSRKIVPDARRATIKSIDSMTG